MKTAKQFKKAVLKYIEARIKHLEKLREPKKKTGRLHETVVRLNLPRERLKAQIEELETLFNLIEEQDV